MQFIKQQMRLWVKHKRKEGKNNGYIILNSSRKKHTINIWWPKMQSTENAIK